MLTTVIVALICLLIGILAGYIVRKNVSERTIGSAEQTAKNMILDAEKEEKTIKKEISLEVPR